MTSIDPPTPKKKTIEEIREEYAIGQIDQIFDRIILNIGKRKELNGYRGEIKQLIRKLRKIT